MTTVTSPNSRNKITLAIDEAFMSDVIMQELTQSGFHLMTINVDTDIVEILGTEDIDGIVTGSKLATDYLQSDVISEQYIILIVPDDEPMIDEYILSKADAILPANPHYLLHQLKTLFGLRKENYQLQKQIKQLRGEIEIQRRKTSEIELLKNAIVRNVSHELRTPLLQVKSAVSMMAEDFEEKTLVAYAQNATTRLETHVKHITMLGQSLDTNPSAIILRDTVAYAQRNLNRRGCDTNRIHLKIDEGLPPVLADKQGIGIVLQSLIDNALKFSEDKPVEVIGQLQGDKVYVGIRDFGIGIEHNNINDIFETFYQIDSSSTRAYGGAGVGLALVKLILDSHNIDIHVDSTVGEGSTFWFELPTFDMSDID